MTHHQPLTFNSIIETISREIAAVTGRSLDDLDIDQNFAELGIESLQAVQIISQVKDRLQISLELTALFNFPTIRKLAEFILESSSDKLSHSRKSYENLQRNNEPIAIVGIGVKVPKAKSVQEFWDLLQKGEQVVTRVPPHREELSKLLTSSAVSWGGFLEDPYQFDHAAFKIAEAEAQKMDPQQRLLLETTWQAVEDAGLSFQALNGSRTGVYIGISSSDFSLQSSSQNSKDIFSATGNAHSIAANRISYLFNLRGPSVSIDTACSSSLVALHQACLSLRNGEIDLALVGGVNLILNPDLTKAFSQAQMLSPDGRCFTFSDQANGYVRGEGVGVILIKSLTKALQAHDRIYAVIKGSAINQDGKSNGLTAPNGLAQEEVILEALSRSGLNAQDITYLEAHGTGTPLGDPIEYHALDRLYKSESRSCYVGSVKTNIGHLEAAAGILGLIKTSLSLQHHWIPAHLNFKNFNPKIIRDSNSLKVPISGMAWDQEGLRSAGVSSFGFGGTNAHVILQEWSPPSIGLKSGSSAPTPLPSGENFWSRCLALSASHPEGLQSMAKSLSEFLNTAPVEDIAGFSQKHRFSLDQQLLVFATDLPEVQSSLKDLERKSQHLSVGKKARRRIAKIGYLYTGQGSQFLGMGSSFYNQFFSYRRAFEDCCEELNAYLLKDLYSVIHGFTKSESHEFSKENLLTRTDYGQAALFANGYALTQMLKTEFNLEPHVVFGHSLGEYIAAVEAGVFSLKEACALVASRGAYQQKTLLGGMTALMMPVDLASTWIHQESLLLDIAAVNGPSSVVASGPVEEIEKIERLANLRKVRWVRLKVDRAFHSHLMNPILDEFLNKTRHLKVNSPRIPLISSLTGQKIEHYPTTYFVDHLRKPTLFYQAMQTLFQENCTHIVEIGPHPTLIPMLKGFDTNSKTQFKYLMSHHDKGTETFFQTISDLVFDGVISPPNNRTHVPLFNFPKTIFTPSLTSPYFKKEMDRRISMPKQDLILEELRKMVGQLLQINPNDFNVDEPLIELGADSLLLLNAIQTIKDKYQVSIAISDIFQDLSTLRALADHVARHSLPPSASQDLDLASNVQTQDKTLKPSSLSLNLPATEASSREDLQSVIQNQIQLMNLQLQILNRADLKSGTMSPEPSKQVQAISHLGVKSSSSSTSTSFPSSSSSNNQGHAEPPESPRRGVLGHWSAFASKETLTLEDERKKNYLEKFIAEFSQKTKKTKEHTQKYRKALADNRVSAGFRPQLKEVIYPIICKEARGAHFTDLDNNQYIDFSMGFGVNLFGHSPTFIDSAIKSQLNESLCVGPQSELAGPVAQLLCDVTKMERAAFCNSGTEAVMTAIRLARAVTKRKAIVIFDGSYHGHFDGVLARRKSDGKAIPVAPGVTQGFVEDVNVLEYGTEESLQFIRTHASQLAAVLVEPVQSRFPELQPRHFLQSVRTITSNSGTALIFDEVITGFRIAPGGSQEHFGIQADLASYGKILGGAFPIGAVAGKEIFMNPIDGGPWAFGDTSFPQAEMTFFAGTFSKHPLAMAAAKAVLEKVKKEGASICHDLNEKTTALAQILNSFFENTGIDIQVVHFGSLFRFKAPLNLDLFFLLLNHQGMYIWEGKNMFLSTAHSSSDIEQFIAAVKRATEDMVTYGFFKKKSSHLKTTELALLPSQERFCKLSLQSPLGEAASHICLSVKMKGPVDLDLLKTSLNHVISQHDVFRLRVNLKTRHQWFVDNSPLIFDFMDLSNLENPYQSLNERLIELGRRPFDLQKETPLRFALCQLGEENFVLGMVAHHLHLDGWSIAQFIEEVSQYYSRQGREFLQNQETKKHGSQLSFESFLKHPEKFGSISRMQNAAQYWKQEWTLHEPRTILWKNKGENSLPSLEGSRVVFTVEYNLHQKIKRTAKSLKVSPLMLLLSIFGEFISKKTEQQSFTVGVPAALRDLDGADKMLGNCANLLPIHIVTNKGTQHPLDYVLKVKEQMLNAYKNMMYPFEKIQELLDRPLFNVTFNVEPTSELPDFGEVSLFIHPFPVQAVEFDMMVNITDLDLFYHGEIDFKHAIFKEDEIIRWSDELISFLQVFCNKLDLTPQSLT